MLWRLRSHPVRGAWIEIQMRMQMGLAEMSHPVRGAWIEMKLPGKRTTQHKVAPREGCVD